MRRSDRELPRRLTFLSTLVVAFIVTAIAVLGYWLGGTVEDTRYQTLIYSISSALLSIGVVGLAYELFLRRSVSEELLRLVGVERSVVQHSLKEIARAGELDWPEILEPASSIWILVSDPGPWIRQHWQHLVRGGTDRPIELELIVPDPSGSWIEGIASSRGLSAAELTTSIRQALRIVEENWKSASDRGELHVGSSVSVRLVDKYPTSTIVWAGSTLVVISFRSTYHPTADSGLALVYAGRTPTYPMSAYIAELKELAAAPAEYANTVGGGHA